MTKLHNPSAAERIAQLAAENDRFREALETIDRMCTDEINVRFPPTMRSRSEAEEARGSRIYSLLVMPRNIARKALGGNPIEAKPEENADG